MKELWQKAVKGDQTAEDEIFQRLHDRFLVLAGLVMCKEDAEDIANEACGAVLKGYKSLGEPFEYHAWAQKVLKNKIASYFQRKSVEAGIFDREKSVLLEDFGFAGPGDPDMVRSLISCLQKLIREYPRYARVINLVQLGYSADEICGKMNISKDNLYVILNRGRRILKGCIFGEKL